MTTLEASPPSAYSLFLVFRNGQSLPMNIFWLDFKGEEKLWTSLQSGMDLVQQVYLGHIWRIKVKDRVYRFVADEKIQSGSVLLMKEDGFVLLSRYDADKPRVRVVFNEHSKEKKDSLNFAEFKCAAPFVGINADEGTLREMFGVATTGDSLTFDEFYRIIAGPPPPPPTAPPTSPTPTAPPPSYEDDGKTFIVPPAPIESKDEPLPTSDVKFEKALFGTKIISNDSKLNDGKELESFLHSQRLPRPDLTFRIYGHHTVTTTTGVGKNRRTHSRRVTDFDYRLNLSDFIHGTGTMSDNLNEAMEGYLASTNKLKRLVMKKGVSWPGEKALADKLRAHIRKKYWGTIEISSIWQDDLVQVNSDDPCGVCLRSTACDVFAIVSCLWIFWCPLKYCLQKTFNVSCTYAYQAEMASEFVWQLAQTYDYSRSWW